MKIKTIWLVTLFALFSTVSVFAESKSKKELAEMAVSADSAVQAEAIKNLRTMGKDGLDALFQTYSAEIAKFSATGVGDEDWKRITFALDSVAMQKDVYASKLYWFTDLEEAKREAGKSNKPILSLRLLGNLNEEFSCANSRFFRALLYSNSEVSKYLRENYVLHWKSVRPAPKVTIDFGDGRKIERTITGNSIHYILDENGEIIDAIPGLYAPSDFLKYLTKGKELNTTLDALPKDKKELAMLRYRKLMFDDIKAKRNKSVAAAKVTLTEPKDGTDASEVAPRAVTKMITETSILSGISDDFSRFESSINLDDWKKLSKLYAGATKFDEVSVAFIKRQNAGNGLTNAQFTSLLTNLAGYVTLDTTRNDFLFHTKLYEWLNAQRAKPLELESFNSRVYADLFKTPDSDKWLGLYNTDVYTALDGNGIIK
ncbi:MAG TPA: hypothetical protein VNB22_14800 [Pyrinomonadaceae bacterium]|nr:hypothetical protein [Pyrinomonadaceae bacterium]